MKLSIIIVSWNTRNLLKGCLASIYQGTVGLAFEVWVVDNNSIDGSVAMVRSDFPSVKIISNQENIGFATANNQAIKKSIGEYILLLNSDTVVYNGAVGQMVQFMDEHPDAGAATGRLLLPDGTAQSYIYGNDPTLSYLIRRNLTKIIKKRDLHNWDSHEVLEVQWVTGAFMMVRRAVIDKVGGLDENIFMYFEDNEWCYRMRQQGWKVYYNPKVEIAHLAGQSFGQQDEARKEEYFKGLIYFYRKHYGPLRTSLLQVLLKPYQWFISR